ncbi:hypothetical protein K469DRAFT_84114 [Zopfia rhizophila CBS 207.26]|uniref:Secreted protein n=1 Tax=Zopfia rhizophila CBS 207.26 TaxID=1314779 RepID=A0A6A6E9T1_9PEZI|nr:hypothetical protein K469DRAFT_84114 [Zopfia rhizophila CBS 207.26]
MHLHLRLVLMIVTILHYTTQNDVFPPPTTQEHFHVIISMHVFVLLTAEKNAHRNHHVFSMKNLLFAHSTKLCDHSFVLSEILFLSSTPKAYAIVELCFWKSQRPYIYQMFTIFRTSFNSESCVKKEKRRELEGLYRRGYWEED